eukprot:UN07715
MSLTALQLANDNFVSRIIFNQNLPVICASALATIHFASAFRMSMMRFNIGDDTEKLEPNTPFDYARRAQMNIAEYSGSLIALLLFIQYRTNSGDDFTKIGRFGGLMTVIGSVIYYAGYSAQGMGSQSRIFGAVMRYFGFMGLLYQTYRYTKN